MSQRFSSLFAALALAAASGFVAAPVAMAQSEAQQQTVVSPQELRTFASAAKEVQKINQSYQPSYQSAQTPEQKQAIEREAMGKMTQAVQAKGMTIQKYNQIMQIAQTDPEVGRQVDEYAREAR